MWVRSTQIVRVHALSNLLSPYGATTMRYASTSVIKDSMFLKQPRVSVVGAPMHLGQPINGTDDGPRVLRDYGLQDRIESLHWEFNDTGDVDIDSKALSTSAKPKNGLAHNCSFVGSGNERIATAVEKSAKEKSFVLTIGGDHSIAIGTLAGMLSVYPNLGVVWVDAHADINTPLTSDSGNMHGMPVGLVMKLKGTQNLPGFDWLEKVPTLKPSQVAYIGLRDIDDGERKALRELEMQGMYVTTMADVDAMGIGKVVEGAIKSLGPNTPLHLSYDIDALDPGLAPSTGTRVPGGLTFREGHFVAENIASTGRLVSMDMVEVNSNIGDTKQVKLTSELAVDLISSALGSKIY